MAKQIEGVSEKIEKCAREEFLKNGYTDASLRTIASEPALLRVPYIPDTVIKRDFFFCNR